MWVPSERIVAQAGRNTPVRHVDPSSAVTDPQTFNVRVGTARQRAELTAKVTRVVPIRARLGYGSAVHKTVSQATEQLGRMKSKKPLRS